ncbi:ribonuclease HIII [Mycoplasma tullyi]|uniref:Ribonuclease n=1 Tax=Mycoplasma tullyi TaxID=1612150 RepID=A0A7D7UC39_9MOLU|nr:ribonuclease HIII [Mycoplasma tullyi]QMT98246.1 ribonuclease HIII [Mycoplasma tullyi]
MEKTSYSFKKLAKEIVDKFIGNLKTLKADEVKTKNTKIYKRFHYLNKAIIIIYKTNTVTIQRAKSGTHTDLDRFVKQHCFWNNASKNNAANNKGSKNNSNKQNTSKTVTSKVSKNNSNKQNSNTTTKNSDSVSNTNIEDISKLTNVSETKTSVNNKKTELINNQNDFLDQDTIGCDEVGVGEYLGPIVTCCALVRHDQIDRVKKLGVKDSKKLSDEKIVEIANELKKFIKFEIFCFDPNKGTLGYNQMHERLNSLEAVKAYMHNAGLTIFKLKYQTNNPIILDQAVQEDRYYEYLEGFKDLSIVKIDLMETKSESKYLSVATASILARAFYLELCKELLHKIGYTDDYKLMLGTSNEIFERIKTYIQENPHFNWKYAFKVHMLAKFLESL